MIEPRCLKGELTLSHSSTGFIVPCCNFDKPYCIKYDIPELTQEKFNLKNINSIEEVLNSEEWQSFFKNILNKSNSLPQPCHYYCSENPKIDRIKVDNE